MVPILMNLDWASSPVSAPVQTVTALVEMDMGGCGIGLSCLLLAMVIPCLIG